MRGVKFINAMRPIIALIALFFSHLSYGGDLYKLRVGLVWQYELEGAEQKVAKNSIIRSVVVNEVEWFELSEYGERFWVRNTEQGQVEAVNFFDRDIDLSEPAEEVLIFKHPASVGETWGRPNSPTSYLGLREVTVPAGTFNCHMYRFDLNAGAFSESCIAEEIGVVVNRFKRSDGSTEVSKLSRYEK